VRRAPDMEEIERLVAQRGPKGMRLTDPTLLAAFRCYLRSTETTRSERVLIAGDAAHVHSPAGGQGLNTGLHDAFNLGWKLALVARGQAPPALLDTYEAERGPIATSVLAFTHGLVRTFSMPSPRRRGSRADHETARNAIARLEPWDGIVKTIVISDEPLDSESVGDPGLSAHRRYDALAGQLLLVRPDGHLASRAPLDPSRHTRAIPRAARSEVAENRSARQTVSPASSGSGKRGAITGGCELAVAEASCFRESWAARLVSPCRPGLV
jgi:FAD binding domain